MRETLKSLSIFSVMLLLLLLISSGCDVNIPGCGKRSLPFFKPVVPPTPTPAPASTPNVPAPNAMTPAIPAGAHGLPPVSPAAPAVKPKPSPGGETSVEMSISQPKAASPTPTFTATATPTPMEVEKIAFTTLEHGKPTLWAMNTDGTDRTRLTPVGSSSWLPLWSPNGKMLAFLSDMNDGKMNLFVMKKDGTGVQQLTALSDLSLSGISNLKSPFSWSPKSDEIAYCYHNQVWKVSLDNLSNESLATEDPSYSVSALEWAPHRDNRYVAYLVQADPEHYVVKLVNPRLKDQLTLDTTKRPIEDLSWTPDARDVGYLVGGQYFYTASSQNSLPKMQLNNATASLGPLLAYSPAESGASAVMFLAKQADTDAGWRVATLAKASTGPSDPGTLKFLTDPGVDDAIWSPDGSKIAYVLDGDLWVMDAGGSGKHLIAQIGVQSPCWSKK